MSIPGAQPPTPSTTGRGQEIPVLQDMSSTTLQVIALNYLIYLLSDPWSPQEILRIPAPQNIKSQLLLLGIILDLVVHCTDRGCLYMVQSAPPTINILYNQIH